MENTYIVLFTSLLYLKITDKDMEINTSKLIGALIVLYMVYKIYNDKEVIEGLE